MRSYTQAKEFMSGPPNNVVQLRKVKTQRAQAKVLCDSDFHKWRVLKHSQFDVKLGKLVTLERCMRCGKERTRAT